MRTTMREEHLRGSSCVGMAMALALAGCGTWLNEEHCLFEGGDRGCGFGRSCVVVIDGGEVPEASNGCLDSDDAAELDPQQYLHLRYGLPMALEAENDVLRSDSVQGILAREIASRGLEHVCSDVEGAASFDGWPALDLVFDARERLEGLRNERKVRGEDAAVRVNEAHAVRDLYASIDAWVLACEGELEGSSGSETEDTTDTIDESTAGSTTEGPQCTSNEDCAAAEAPFCDPVAGVCVTCDMMPDPDAACTELNPAAPVCAEEACVACTASNPGACEEQSLVCDTVTNSCNPCMEHAECGEAACDFFAGTCFPTDAVLHIGPMETFDSIAAAVASFAPGEAGTIIVHGIDYFEAVTVDGGRRIALLAAPGETPSWDSSVGPQLTVELGATAFIDGLRIAGNSTNAGLVVNGGRAWLDRVQLVNNSVGSSIDEGAELVLRNCTAGYLHGGGDHAVLVSSSSARILYSTLIGDNGFGESLHCDTASSVEVRNSIVVTYDGNPIDCPGMVIDHSATTNSPVGFDTVDVGPIALSWFADYTDGDFHLSASGENAFAGIAQWQPGDPSIDLDGDPRPGIDGSPDYPGADVPNP